MERKSNVVFGKGRNSATPRTDAMPGLFRASPREDIQSPR
jgi:hypothetical protein